MVTFPAAVPVASNCVLPFKQTAAGFADALTLGGGFTVTVTVVVLLQPAALAPVIV